MHFQQIGCPQQTKNAESASDNAKQIGHLSWVTLEGSSAIEVIAWFGRGLAFGILRNMGTNFSPQEPTQHKKKPHSGHADNRIETKTNVVNKITLENHLTFYTLPRHL